MEDPEAPFLVMKDNVSFIEKRPYRWICEKNLPIQEDAKAVLERASSVFVALEKSRNALPLLQAPAELIALLWLVACSCGTQLALRMRMIKYCWVPQLVKANLPRHCFCLAQEGEN
jgi:hypothetical protein